MRVAGNQYSHRVLGLLNRRIVIFSEAQVVGQKGDFTSGMFRPGKLKSCMWLVQMARYWISNIVMCFVDEEVVRRFSATQVEPSPNDEARGN